MDDATRAELADLRRRAYGPDADIARDSAALDRLIELEADVLQDQVVVTHAAHALAPTQPAVTAGTGSTAPATSAPAAASRESTAASAESTAASAEPTRFARIHPLQRAKGGGFAQGRWFRAEPGDRPEDEPADGSARRRLVAVGIAAVLAVGAAVVVATVTAPDEQQATPMATSIPIRDASSFARDPRSRIILEVPLDGSFGNFVELPANDTPAMPASGPLQWAAPLGEYYGWELWIAGASGALQEEHCLLIRRGDKTEGRCVPATLRSQSSLVVDLGYADIDPSERPSGMAEDQRIGFWWFEDNAVTILIGPASEQR